ncbi:MAG TPA: anti-sigma factor [Myxococcaceae bacterium]|nr:anti-sigma factor [Myxococcaceae bacterium]
MTHQEFLDQVDAYALGALESGEARALEQHLTGEGPHPLCEAALARARETVATLAADLKPVSPPPRVWEGIARAIAQGQESAPRAPAPASPRLPVSAPAGEAGKALRRTPPWTYAIAAAAVVMLVLGGINVRDARQSAAMAGASAAECARELAEARIDVLRKEDALQLLLEPGTQIVSLKPSPGPPTPLAQGTGVVLFNPRGRALFLGKSFAAQATRDYELWLIRDGKPIAAGLLPPGPDGRVFSEVRPDVLTGGRPAAFAVSVEPKGGERVAPRGPIILTGAVAAP